MTELHLSSDCYNDNDSDNDSDNDNDNENENDNDNDSDNDSDNDNDNDNDNENNNDNDNRSALASFTTRTDVTIPTMAGRNLYMRLPWHFDLLTDLGYMFPRNITDTPTSLLQNR